MRLGLAPDSAKAMEREAWLEGVGRVDNISNLCFSDEDRLESSVADSTLNQLIARKIKANTRIIMGLFSMLCRSICTRFMEGKKKIDESRNQDVGPPR